MFRGFYCENGWAAISKVGNEKQAKCVPFSPSGWMDKCTTITHSKLGNLAGQQLNNSHASL
jgi:hypothetical protein